MSGTVLGLVWHSTAAVVIFGALIIVGVRAADPRTPAPADVMLAPIVLLPTLVATGAFSGARAATAIRASCESSLETGTRVVVRGYATERAGGSRRPGRSSSLRVSLEDVVVSTSEGECRIPRLAAFVVQEDAADQDGPRLEVEGEWLRLRARSQGVPGPVVPGRAGIVVEARVTGSARDVPISTDGAMARLRAARRSIRMAAADQLRARLSPDVDAVGRALLLAERNELSTDLRRRFVDAGLAHLLAISGLHVGIIGGLILALLRPLARGPRLYLVAAGFVGLYVALLGAPTPALRASLLFSGWAVSRFIGRPVRVADLVGAAALVFLTLNPAAILEPGFQLSFAGFAGISIGPAILRESSARRRRHRPGRSDRGWRGATVIGTAVLVGVGAFLATAPIAAWHFGRIAPVSVVSNLVGSPVVAVSIWGLTGALLPDPVGTWFAAGATICLRVLVAAVDWFGSWTGGHRVSGPPSPETWSAWLISFAVLGGIARGGSFLRALVPAAFVSFLLIGRPLTRVRDHYRSGLLCTLSVGQGDAAILRTFEGRWIVFDGGPDLRPGAGREEIGEALRRRGARSVALIVLSHPDLDHIGGLPGLVSSVPVGGVLDTADPVPRVTYARLLALAEEAGVPWLPARTGTRIRIGDAEVVVLGPGSADDRHTGPGPASADRPRLSANQTSLAVRVSLAGFVYLNTGDATAAEEAQILESWPRDSLRADVLKIGHHGSRTSTSTEWLSAVRPKVAVISAGAGNRYGHPHSEVLSRLDRADVPVVWRTDRKGSLCIEIRRDGAWRIDSETAWIAPLDREDAGWHGD